MTLTKKKVFSLLLVAILGFMCFGMFGCSEASGTNYLTYEGECASVVTVGGTLAGMLAGLDLKYDPTPEDGINEEKGDWKVTGLAAMKEKGVSVVWSGATQEMVDNGTKGVISIAFAGEVITFEYTVKAAS